MSFDTRETSEYDGEPTELYWFMRGTDEWLYSSGPEEVTFSLKTFEPLAGLTRTNFKIGTEQSKNQLTVNMPRDTAIATEFIGIPDIQPVWLNVYRIHDGETDFSIAWQGRVRTVEFKGNTATITLDNLLVSLKKASFRHLFQGQCNHFTYDLNCTLQELDFTKTSTVATIDSNQITLDDSEAADFFTSGQVRRANGDRRFVTGDSKSGSTHTLTLLTAFENLEVGETVTLIGGACRHTFATCQAVKLPGGSTEDNSANYGGYPKVPRTNPFKSFN